MVEAIKANVVQEKSKIVSFLRQTGPNVINSIAKNLSLNSFLASALLSELVNDKAIKASTLRMGGSPLYYIEGQEDQLERFTNFLNHKEREAFGILKKEGVIQDSAAEPAIRVALRSIKDFAIPIKVMKDNNEILFWKYRPFNDAEQKIKSLLGEKKVKKEMEKQEVKEVKEEKNVADETKKIKPSGTKEIFEKWANENGIIVEEILFEKKNELKAKVSMKSSLGVMGFLLVFKGKKSISESDLSLAYQDGLNSKAPVIFLTNGKLSKQSQQYLESLGSNILFKKI